MNPYEFTLSLVREAGTRLKEAQRAHIEVLHKGADERDVITAVDLEINELLKTRIREAFPDHDIYSEEKDKKDIVHESEYQWVLDPIDGTANFSRSIPHFAVCVGLLQNAVPILGAIYNPMTDELFSFEKGRGAFLNGKSIHVTATEQPSVAQGIIVIGHYPALLDWGVAVYRSFLEHLKKVKSLGSSSLDICFLAAGRAEVVVYGTLTTKDCGAAIGLLREAGGDMYTLKGTHILFKDMSQPIIATNNRAMFEALQTYLHTELLPPNSSL